MYMLIDHFSITDKLTNHGYLIISVFQLENICIPMLKVFMIKHDNYWEESDH